MAREERTKWVKRRDVGESGEDQGSPKKHFIFKFNLGTLQYNSKYVFLILNSDSFQIFKTILPSARIWLVLGSFTARLQLAFDFPLKCDANNCPLSALVAQYIILKF